MMLRCLLLAGSLLIGSVAFGAPLELEVQYQTADRVYVNGGSRLGLEPGTRLAVKRDDREIGQVEVVFAATHSASCRVVSSTQTLAPGDRVIWDAPAPVAVPAARVERPVRTSQETPPVPVPQYRREAPGQPELRSSISGSLTFDWEQFTDDSGFGRDFDRSSARLSLRGRNVGGLPIQLRVRSSTRTLDRIVDSDGSTSVTDTRDRLYELSVAYEPSEGRFALRMGRLRLGRYAGAGTLDGLAAEARVAGVFHLGVFGGARADISDFGFDGTRNSYGVTARFTSKQVGGRRELLIAGVREDGETDISREYVAIQARLGGTGRWNFYQRAELDLNRGWRQELTGTSSQLSTLFLNATARVSERNRLSLSYSRFERYRTEETRFIPEELFDENRRQGLRARWVVGRPGKLNVTLSAGLRERDGDADDATSAGLGVSHGNLFGRKFSLGVNVLSFSNQFSDGVTATLRAAKRFKPGHRVTFTLGSRSLDDLAREGVTRETQWARLGGWFELPGRLFARTEFEVSTGDDLEGQRVLVGLGYRF